MIDLRDLAVFDELFCSFRSLKVSQLIKTNLWKFRLNLSSESGENKRKTHPLFPHVSPCHEMCLKYICYSRYREFPNCFNVFCKAFHGIIFQGQYVTITFCKPCKLFVNLWTFFCSVPIVYNGFKCRSLPMVE